MSRSVSFYVVVGLFLSGLAFAEEEALVLQVEKPISTQVLRDAGLLHLADLGASYLVQSDEPAAERLTQFGAKFTKIAKVLPGENIFLLRPRTLRDEVLYSGALLEVGHGQYMAKVMTSEIEDLRLLPFAKVRLIPTAFEELNRLSLTRPLTAVVPKPAVQSMVAAVSSDTLSKYISQLSGREPVSIGGGLDTLLTRYSYSWRIHRAAEYLYERFEDYGIDVSYHYYEIGKYDFYSTHFSDASNGWVVGSGPRVFRTRDGGQTWISQPTGVRYETWWGVCFLDTVKGWVSGTTGTIIHSTDSGESWTEQSTPTSVTLREICFLDSLNGWVVGYAGMILSTTDGGQTWAKVTSGTGNDLYGCHFQSLNRGWACGESGTILYWNGSSWSPQTSGTGEHLLDVHFIDDNTGWIVGGGRTILKTADGGQNWSPQTAPAEANPYLKGICFVDSVKGWTVGLSGTILHTADGGGTWAIQDTPTLFGLRWVRFVDDSEGWAVGYGAVILHTDDGGLTWENQRQNLPSGALTYLENVVATKPGTISGEQCIICGHFDCTSEDPQNLAPGADDNASGTAAVIEAARVMADRSFEKTVKFMCFSGEEQGLIGSGEYAAAAKGIGDSIIGVVNLDMIGYVNAAPEDIDVIGDPASEWLVDFTIDCCNAYVPGLPTYKLIDAGEVYSDHASFWKAGYDALLGIEDHNVPYPYYHTTGDTLGNLTMPFATDVTKMGIATLAELARPDTTASVIASQDIAPAAAVYPNPFRSETRISFGLGSSSSVKISIFSTEGRLVKTVHQDWLPAGRYDLAWRGDDDRGRQVSPGIYFTRIETGGRTHSAKTVRLR